MNENFPSVATSCFGSTINLESVLDTLAASGFRGVEIMSIPSWFEHLQPENMSANERRQVRDRIDGRGLKLVALSGHCEIGSEAGLMAFLDRIDLASDLEAPLVITSTSSVTNDAQSHYLIHALELIIKRAEKRQIRIGLETDGAYTPTGEKMGVLLAEFDSPHLGVVYDPANATKWADADPSNDVAAISERLFHVHLKDYIPGQPHPPLGQGEIHLENFLSTVQQLQFMGTFSIEIDYRDAGVTDMIDALKTSRDVLKTMPYFSSKS